MRRNLNYFMDENRKLLNDIIEGIQDKKGSGIVVVDMEKIESSICKYFVICQGNSANQISAIAQSVGEKALKNSGSKPYTVSGLQNSLWVAMDYGDIFVHIFQPDEREFYDLEHLWADAELTHIPDAE